MSISSSENIIDWYLKKITNEKLEKYVIYEFRTY